MRISEDLSRRDFVKQAAAAGLIASLATQGKGQESKPDRIRCGFIGVGGRGTRLLKSTLKVPEVDVKAICDINVEHLERAQGIVEEAQGSKPDGYWKDEYHYRSLLKRSDLDAVVIATPCDWHHEMYVDTIHAEKHMYGEKPMCITREHSYDVVAAAEEKPGLVSQIGFQRRSSPRYQEAIRLIHEGEIGELIDGRGAWYNAWGPLKRWFGRRERSGDWMLEQACHTWDVFNWVAQTTPLRAFGIGRKDIFLNDDPLRDVTDYYCAILEYPKGFLVDFGHSWFCPNDGKFTGVYERVAGPKGGVDLPSGTFIYRGKKGEEKQEKVVVPEEGNHTDLAIGSFFDAVRTGRKPDSGVINGRDAVMTGLLVREAVDRGDSVGWWELFG